MAAVVSPTPARADDAQFWAITRINIPVARRVLLGNETIFRTSEERGDYDFVDHVLLGYQLDRKMTIWVGYTHQTAMSHGRTTAIEQRFRQQINLDNVASLGLARFGGRLRLEQRWRQGYAETGWRVRPQVRFSVPLTGGFALMVSHESFINLSKTGFQSESGEERMRNAIAMLLPLNKYFSAEFGYLQQHIFTVGNTARDSSAATVSVAANF